MKTKAIPVAIPTSPAPKNQTHESSIIMYVVKARKPAERPTAV